MAADEVVLVTGAMGCVGAWTVRHLVDKGTPVVAFDIGRDPYRLRLLMDDDRMAQVRFVHGDITDAAQVADVVHREGVTHIVHLAALQVPFCKAEPSRGAQVNVVGTVNVFEAAAASPDQVRGIAYTSSLAVFGAPERYPDGIAADDAPLAPATLYGAYKQANEWTARVYAEDCGVVSVGLRPSVVYGPGRDQGLTSDVSQAMLAAAAGRPFHVRHGGSSTFHYAPDVAAVAVAAAQATPAEPLVLNVGGAVVSVAEVIAAIEAAEPAARGTITFEDLPLPFPSGVDASGLDTLLGGVDYTPLQEGVRRTVEAFRDLLVRGLVAPEEVSV